MKKVINITLSGMVFFIEEDAYLALQQYLEAIKKHFSKFPDHEEIIADMETRIAEHFQDAVGDDKNAAITSGDVASLMHTLGTVEDFSDEERTNGNDSKEQTKNTNRSTAKKLYRNPDDTVLAGVCSGIASYLGVDPIVIRLIFIILTFAGGFMILLYLVLWIIVPVAETQTEKMEMQGNPITLASVDEALKKTIHGKQKTSAARKLISIPVHILTGIARFIKNRLFPLLGRLIGFFMSIGGTIAAIVVTFVFIILLFNINSPYIDFPLKGVVTGIIYYLLIGTVFLVLFLPIIFFITLGSSLLTWRNLLNKPMAWSLTIIWIIALFTAGSIGLRVSPEVHKAVTENPENQLQTLEFKVKDFTGVQVSNSDSVHITRGPEFKVVASGNQKRLEQLQVSITDGVLAIDHVRAPDTDFKICVFCFDFRRNTTIDIQMPELMLVNLSGASSATLTGFKGKNLTITGTGASDIEMEKSEYDELKMELSGASRAVLNGEGYALTALLTGSSRVRAFDFPIATGSLELRGASMAYIHATDLLTVTANGASRVYVEGKAKIESELHGASRIIPETSRSQTVNPNSDTIPAIIPPDEHFDMNYNGE